MAIKLCNAITVTIINSQVNANFHSTLFLIAQ